MRADLKKLYLKISILLLPLIVLLASFVSIDPFGVVHNQKPLSQTSGDFLSTELYLKNRDQVKYNAFIFGNSKTLAFQSQDWKKMLEDSITVFKYGCPGESIFNIYNKICLVKKKNELKHALIILDAAIFANYKNTSKSYVGPVYKHHWLTSDESALNFYGSFFKFYLADFSFAKIIDYSLFKTYRPYMKGVVTNTVTETNVLQTSSTNTLTNEFYLEDLEKEISENGFGAYYEHHKTEFNSVVQANEKEVVMGVDDLECLQKIKEELKESKTDFKIIIGPLSSKQQFPKKIHTALVTVFGKEHVFDFSGINFISADSSNFYERSHYRPFAGKLMLDSAYHYNRK